MQDIHVSCRTVDDSDQDESGPTNDDSIQPESADLQEAVEVLESLTREHGD